jgi:hypothetical protein
MTSTHDLDFVFDASFKGLRFDPRFPSIRRSPVNFWFVELLPPTPHTPNRDTAARVFDMDIERKFRPAPMQPYFSIM